MPRTALVPLVLFLAGGALVVEAVLRGGASVGLLVVLPFVFGSSVEFLLGVVLLFAGFLTLPLAFVSYEEEVEPPARSGPPARAEVPPAEVGGFLLVGPVPVFFGSWKSVSRGTKVAVAALGAALLVLFVLVVLLR